VLIVHLRTRGYPTTVVLDADGVVRMDDDLDVIAMTCQGFVDRVVHDFKHQVVQTRAIGGIADVHAWAFTNSLQTFQNLDRAFPVGICCGNGLGRLRFVG